MSHADSNRLLLTELETHLDQGLAARDQGDLPTARRSLARAEQALLSLARQSRDPMLKARRLEQAERLRAEIDRLVAAPAVSQAKLDPPGAATPTRAGDGGHGFAPEPARPGVRFDQVAGLEEVKREIRLRMILPFSHADQARRWGLGSGGGLLLYGPPGTGKTLIARATAGELDAAFFAIKASDIVSKWFGEAEINVRNLFAAAREPERSVVFIDEIDALAPARSGSNSSVMARLVPQFLAELDGFRQGNNALLLIGATNEPWALDPAMLRPGRLDLLIQVDLPDFPGRRRLLELMLQGKPLAPDLDLERLATLSEGLSGADLRGFVDRVTREGFEASLGGPDQPLTQEQLETWLAVTPRSVTSKQLQRYARFRADHGA